VIGAEVNNMKNVGIYVHIPFCRKKCNYCGFNSYDDLNGLIEPYFEALFREILMYRDLFKNFSVDTIYIGGGTPTCVEFKFLQRLLANIEDNFNVTDFAEITVECNPCTVDKAYLGSLFSAGANRLSLGLQSADDRELSVLGRLHTFDDFGNCYEMARDVGFGNISLDLIYGLPNQTTDGWAKTLEKAVAFCPEHISTYALEIVPGTPFSNMKLNLPSDDACREMYDLCVEFLKTKGYERYEISNFCKPKFESKHNTKYWRCADYLGFGAGAHSCFQGVRFANEKNVPNYINSVNSSKIPIYQRRVLTDKDKISEFMFLGLRMNSGIKKSEFLRKFDIQISDIFGPQIQKFVDLGFMRNDGDDVALTDDGFYVSNSIFSDFIL
jgi:oxygen-independent coproporphyrinogen-3 oxidase